MHLITELKTHKAKTYSNERRNIQFVNNSWKLQGDPISIFDRTINQEINRRIYKI